MTDFRAAMERVINSTPRKYTKEEATRLLKKYGVLTADNQVSEVYKQLIVLTN